MGECPVMVYVDDMAAPFGRMTMCHMLADTTSELLAMADRIGVARRWLQKAGTPQEHFDICLAKRAAAVRAGAAEITMRETALLVRRKRDALKPKEESTAMIRMTKSSKGTTVRATGKDAQALFNAMTSGLDTPRRSVAVYGPEACGKTHNADAIAKALGLSQIRDDWSGRQKDFAPTDTLHLTHMPPEQWGGLHGVQAMTFDEAMRRVRALS